MANGYATELRDDAEHFAAFRARWLGNDPASYATIYRMLVGMDLQAELGTHQPARCWCSAARSTACARRRWPSRSPASIPGARYQLLETGHYMVDGDARSRCSRHRRLPGRGGHLSGANRTTSVG